ncbi:PCMD domain-containing protein [Phocaeicola sp. HCN-40430]|uniref:PCMD domain-containing protein n=1 Tax=Phocaeicola sp. HCN-40430 TaxID=3134664 RepID=UPI0030C17747
MLPLNMKGQEKVVPLKYGNMDQWVTRKIHESGVIGGKTKLLYEVAPTKVIDGNEPYVNLGGSPWANSNVMAKVMGIVKTNTSVYPEKRGNGYCARLETHIESVKVLGLVNITVLASGSLFLGDMKEPITGTKEGEMALNSGVAFTTRPKAVRYDYKVRMSGQPNRIRQTGFSRKSVVPGQDCAIMTCLLQKRTEDAEGNIIAKRVGTAVVRYSRTEDWKNGATYEIMYGDITKDAGYQAELMKLGVGGYYARNSKGESKQIKEVGWAEEGEAPTHLVLQFTSSLGGAFVGSPGNKFWVDNVSLVY